MDSYQDWIGRSEEVKDVITASPAQRMAATLNRADVFTEGTALPAGWHWLYFLPAVRLDHTGADGHAKRGGFLPPVTLPRRMWAGGRLSFHRPLRVGDRLLRKSTVADVTTKQGKSSELVFVLVRHEIIGDEGLALLEEQDIVYRGLSAVPTTPQPAPATPRWSHEIAPDPVLLFRYSALTFNSHRIHFDRTYCIDVEGYPGLVMHGNLTATLLLNLLRDHEPDRTITGFSFRAVAPLYDNAPFRVEGRIDGGEAKLWALDGNGNLAMTASATVG